MIFLGITFSYLFDEWRGERRERAAEAKLLLQFQKELNLKLEEIEGDSGDEDLFKVIEILDSLAGQINSSQVHQLSIPRASYRKLNRYARDVNSYFFTTSIPAFTAAAAGNLWPILPDSVTTSLQQVSQSLTITGNRYTRTTEAASLFYQASLPELVQANLRGDDKAITLSVSTCAHLIAWTDAMKNFTQGDDYARPAFDTAQRQIAARLKELQ